MGRLAKLQQQLNAPKRQAEAQKRLESTLKQSVSPLASSLDETRKYVNEIVSRVERELGTKIGSIPRPASPESVNSLKDALLEDLAQVRQAIDSLPQVDVSALTSGLSRIEAAIGRIPVNFPEFPKIPEIPDFTWVAKKLDRIEDRLTALEEVEHYTTIEFERGPNGLIKSPIKVR